jgi:hypothetical protein
VAYLLADGLSLAADSEAMPARIAPDIAEQMDSGFNPSDEDEDEGQEAAAEAAVEAAAEAAAATTSDGVSFEAMKAKYRGGGSDSDASSSSSSDDDSSDEGDGAAVGVGEVRTFPELEQSLRAAIAELGGAVAPKLTWSTPKDAVWMSTTNNMRCCNPGEVILLLKASDSVAYDLQDAYGQCSDYNQSGDSGGVSGSGASGGGGGGGSGSGGGGDGDGTKKSVSESVNEDGARGRLTEGVRLTLRKWFDLSPAMEFRCFVKAGNLRGICQRDVSNFYPYLPSMVGGCTS